MYGRRQLMPGDDRCRWQEWRIVCPSVLAVNSANVKTRISLGKFNTLKVYTRLEMACDEVNSYGILE